MKRLNQMYPVLWWSLEASMKTVRRNKESAAEMKIFNFSALMKMKREQGLFRDLFQALARIIEELRTMEGTIVYLQGKMLKVPSK